MKYVILILFPCVVYGNSCQIETNLISFLDAEFIQLQSDLNEVKSNITTFTKKCDIRDDLIIISPRLITNMEGHIYSWTFLRDACNVSHADIKVSLWSIELKQSKLVNRIISNNCLNEVSNEVNEVLK